MEDLLVTLMFVVFYLLMNTNVTVILQTARTQKEEKMKSGVLVWTVVVAQKMKKTKNGSIVLLVPLNSAKSAETHGMMENPVPVSKDVPKHLQSRNLRMYLSTSEVLKSGHQRTPNLVPVAPKLFRRMEDAIMSLVPLVVISFVGYVKLLQMLHALYNLRDLAKRLQISDHVRVSYYLNNERKVKGSTEKQPAMEKWVRKV